MKKFSFKKVMSKLLVVTLLIQMVVFCTPMVNTFAAAGDKSFDFEDAANYPIDANYPTTLLNPANNTTAWPWTNCRTNAYARYQSGSSGNKVLELRKDSTTVQTAWTNYSGISGAFKVEGYYNFSNPSASGSYQIGSYLANWMCVEVNSGTLRLYDKRYASSTNPILLSGVVSTKYYGIRMVYYPVKTGTGTDNVWYYDVSVSNPIDSTANLSATVWNTPVTARYEAKDNIKTPFSSLQVARVAAVTSSVYFDNLSVTEMPFTVSTTSLTNGELRDISSGLTVTLSEEAGATTLTTSNIVLKKGSTILTGYTISQDTTDRRKFTVNFNQSLEQNVSYSLELTTSVKAQASTAKALTAQTLSFTPTVNNFIFNENFTTGEGWTMDVPFNQTNYTPPTKFTYSVPSTKTLSSHTVKTLASGETVLEIDGTQGGSNNTSYSIRKTGLTLTGAVVMEAKYRFNNSEGKKRFLANGSGGTTNYFEGGYATSIYYRAQDTNDAGNNVTTRTFTAPTFPANTDGYSDWYQTKMVLYKNANGKYIYDLYTKANSGVTSWKFEKTIKPFNNDADLSTTITDLYLQTFITNGSTDKMQIDWWKVYTITDAEVIGSINFTATANSGTTESNLLGKTAIYPKFTINNNILSNLGNKDVAVVIALYNSSNQLVNVTYTTKTLSAAQTLINDVGLTGISPSIGYYVKAFIWDSISNIKPIATTPGRLTAQ